MPKDTFANRFQLALNMMNLKQVDICERTGFSSSLVNKYITGKAVPRQKKIYLLSQILNVNPAWLMGFDVPSTPIPSHIDKEQMEDSKARSYSMSIDEKKEELLTYVSENHIDALFAIPLYSKIKLSLEDSENFIEGYIPLNPHMYNMKKPDGYFYLRMYDDSMNQKYQEGDCILMKKNSTIKNDTIVLLIYNNSTLIRKVTSQGDLVLLEPLSSNTTKYKTQACPKENVKILGTVIGYIGYERSN